MTKIETILNQIPKKRLSFRTDLMIRREIHKRIWLYRLKSLVALFSFSFFPERRMLAAILLIMFLLTGTSAYAYNSNYVAVGHPLFLLKNTMEDVELNLTSGADRKAIKYAKFSQKRISEADAVSEKKKGDVSANLKKTLDDSMENFEKAKVIIGKNKSSQSVVDKIEKTKKENLDKVREIAAHHDEYVLDAVKPAIVFYQEDEDDEGADDGAKRRGTSTKEREDKIENKQTTETEKEAEDKIKSREIELRESEEYQKEKSSRTESRKEGDSERVDESKDGNRERREEPERDR